jgi:hypothetical protein
LWRKFGAAVNGTESRTWRNILIDISQQMVVVTDSVTESHCSSYTWHQWKVGINNTDHWIEHGLQGNVKVGIHFIGWGK